MKIVRIFIMIFLLQGTTAEARMYQWVDPDTGTTQLSGKPPAWYRAGTGGPRVIVIEKGKIIDDTSINISEGQRDALRQQALLRAEEDRSNAIRKAQEAEEMKARISMGPEEEFQVISEEETTVMPEEQEQPVIQIPDQDLIKAEQMRALITEWEKQMTEQAREKAGLGTDDNFEE